MLTGISGSKTWRSCDHTASGSGAAPVATGAKAAAATFSPRASAFWLAMRMRPMSVITV